MHFYALVIGSEPATILKNYQDTELDWFQIGGRFTGSLVPYDIGANPENKEPCPIHTLSHLHCQMCKGTGLALKWPTEWAPYDEDTKTAGWVVEQLEKRAHDGVANFVPFAYVTHESFVKSEWWDEESQTFVNETEFDQKLLQALKGVAPDTPVTVVDCHD